MISYFELLLLVAALLCSLVAGLLFAFAVVVMPGIRNLKDREFIRAFQVIDDVIQKNQPLFMLAWVGSIIILVLSALLGFEHLAGMDLIFLLLAALIYLFGVQIPTIIINVPLNNKLQAIEVDTLSESEQKLARKNFEARWNRWNIIRTILSIIVIMLLFILLVRL